MKRLLLLLTAFLLCSYTHSTAQISESGTPLSFDVTAKGFNDNIPSEWLPTMNVEQVRAEDEAGGGFYKIGRIIPVGLTTNNSGLWQTLPNGDRIWRLKVQADNNAKGLNPYFDDFYLPAGAKLFLYNAYKEQVLGAYTQQNNPTNGTEFATEHIRDNNFIIEYYEPAGTSDQVRLSISGVGYAYRGVKPLRETRNFGDSEACEVNVNCSPVGDDWQDEKNGIARILVTVGEGQGWCSGSLINNARQDCTPYFLTALHCGLDGSSLTTAANLNQWIFYFNYEAPGCTNPNSEGTLGNQSITGCTAKSNSNDSGGDSGSDFLLLELSSQPSAAYGVYYVGWNANNTSSNSGASLHHPGGDIMKISTYSTNLASVQWGSAAGSHWQVTWSSNTNGWGVTEGGSSGSGIFNSAGNLIGTLTGGGASCTAQSSPDQYGKMSYHWTSNGGAANQQLKPWLDPDNTGILTLNGVFAPCNVVVCTLTAAISGTPTGETCATNDGTATVAPANAIFPITYAWSNGETTASASALPFGINTVTVTDGSGCTATAEVSVTNACESVCELFGNYDLATGTPTLIGSSSSNGGYVAGHNGYGDLAKADYFAYSGIQSEIDGAFIRFAVSDAGSATSTFNVVMWDGTGGTPGAAITQTAVTYQSMADSIAAGSVVQYITFPTPGTLPASGEFFLGVEFTYGADTVALVTNNDGETVPGTAWEQWSDNSWVAYSSSWGLNVSHFIFPQTTCGSSCPAVIAENSAPISSGTYHAGQTVTSSGTVTTGSSVSFKAGDVICLENNFEAGHDFSAEIEACGPVLLTAEDNDLNVLQQRSSIQPVKREVRERGTSMNSFVPNPLRHK